MSQLDLSGTYPFMGIVLYRFRHEELQKVFDTLSTNNELKSDKIQFMTLIVALKSKDGIILAGDRRTYDPKTTVYDDDAVKVFKLNEKVAIAAAGRKYDCMLVINKLLSDPSISKLSLKEVCDLTNKLAKAEQTEILGMSPSIPMYIRMGIINNPEFAFILAGIEDNNPKIYSLTNTEINPIEIPNDHYEIGLPDIARYIFHKRYRKSMSLEEVSELSKSAIEDTADLLSGVSKEFDLIKLKSS